MGKSIGGATNDIGYSIAVDASDNVYTTGNFQGTSDFDPGAGTFNLTSAGSYDIFISKLDASGNFVWAKKMGAAFGDIGSSIAVDASGNVYTSGNFQGTVDFDPGAGTYNLTSAGSDDIFISKSDASGNFVWAKNIGGTSGDIGHSIAVDASDNVYTTGSFQGIVDFDPGAGTYNLTSVGTDDIFVSKLDASGSFVWARNMGGASLDDGQSLAVDALRDVYVTGYFRDIADLDPGTAINNFTSAGETDIFILKFSQAIWSGSLSNVWSDPANWNSGVVPGVASDVVIPSGLTVYPTVFNSSGVKSLLLQNGAAITVNTGSDLTILSNVPAVTIYNQTWMLKNLDVVTYRNGDSIPKVTDPTAWAGFTTGAYCYYNNDSATYAATYGKLYNWYAVNDPRGLAPSGWHIPTDAEWTTLTTNLGGEPIAGDKLKEAGLAHWVMPNAADNSSGFTALPGGGRLNTGGINSLTGERGYWWSSTEQAITNAWSRALVYATSNTFRTATIKKSGYSIRCIKD